MPGRKGKPDKDKGRKGDGKHDKRGGRPGQGAGVRHGGHTVVDEKPATECRHFEGINHAQIDRMLGRRAFMTAVSGRPLSGAQLKELSQAQPEVDWVHMPYLHMCLICGRAVDGAHLDDHFLLGAERCKLALIFEQQQIHCIACEKVFPILPGTRCAKLLGMDYCEHSALIAATPRHAPAPRERLRGLVNMGNSCWMNSVLQVLVRVPNLVAEPRGPLTGSLLALAAELREPGGRAVRPEAFVRELCRKIDILDVREQHDAVEFVALFLDALRDEQGGTSAGLRSNECVIVESCLTTPVDRAVAFVMQTHVRCEACGRVDTSFERSVVVSLCVPWAGVGTLKDCLQVSFSEALVDVDKGERLCEELGIPAECATWPSFVPPLMPRVLVLHLSRFRLGREGDWVKNNLRVDFPEVLALGDVFDGLDLNYRLLGFVSHAGTMQGGHYIAVARVGDAYFMFNDDTVTPVPIERAKTLQAYMLFYEVM